MASLFNGFLFLWLIAYPFIYGQLLSRAFGLKKPIDHWILFCLHKSVSILAYIVFIVTDMFLHSDLIGLIVAFVPLFVLEGLVWQFSLKDRKLNGFLISLICNVIYCIPIFVTFAPWVFRHPFWYS